MENIRRSLKLFFAIYGGLLFRIIITIVVFLFTLSVIDNLYKNSTEVTTRNNTIQEQEVVLENEKYSIAYISKFLDFCNENKIEEAYKMLSEDCIKQKYQTIDIFKKEYIDKIFTYKKEYKIEKEEKLYRITILDGVLESGSKENRKSIISYYKIEEDLLEKYIYIER